MGREERRLEAVQETAGGSAVSSEVSSAAFSTIVERLEVGRFQDEDRPEESVWNLHILGADEDVEDDYVVLSGYLRRNGQEGFGQAIASGLLEGVSLSEKRETEEDWAKFVSYLSSYFAETIYDTARRALQSAAAQLDFSFELSVQAPEANIHEPVRAEESNKEEDEEE